MTSRNSTECCGPAWSSARAQAHGAASTRGPTLDSRPACTGDQEIIESHGYIPHVVGRHTEADAKRRNPARKARRWVVEVCHSWFNRFRKLLVRYEKLERSFVALNHIAAAIIAFRKVRLTVNNIYG